MKRNYIVKVTKNSRKFLLVEFDSSSCQSLSSFLNSEVHNFYTHIYKELEYYQMDDESLGEPCFISTDEIYKLVIEWKEMEDKMYRGEDIFPLMIED